MNSEERIEELLSQITDLLNGFGQERWGRTMGRLLAEFRCAPVDTARRIQSMYAGMGSFNDIVLWVDGGMPRLENEKLDRMRSELFTLVVELRH